MSQKRIDSAVASSPLKMHALGLYAISMPFMCMHAASTFQIVLSFARDCT